MNEKGIIRTSSTAPVDPFEVSVNCGAFAAREALSKILETLAPLDLDVEERSTIELVMAEVVNNIVEHAYPPEALSGPIVINCRHQPDGLHIEVTDQGRSMPNGKLPLGLLSPNDVALDDLPEGGFGWFLIQHLTKDVSYARIGNENQLKLRLAVGMT